MKLSTAKIWEKYHPELHFFTLKRVKNPEDVNEILQNTFVKIHINLYQLKQQHKVKQWIFQITRNEIINFLSAKKTTHIWSFEEEILEDFPCCFDRFIDELPHIYKMVVIPVHFQGRKQAEVAKQLGISLPNVKARLRRAKALLKERFKTCCNYQINKNGLLMGEPECVGCDTA
ncbi:MAG: sigma-70 family RNA polymerase sigma factor [Bacteroidota bacterium]